ncbi:MAG: hypothetical protein C4558_07265 [Dehalococcoidia bacterium]|nr:MAG: hypothetical protein C4558_07265 [Dehalococcoidia bacterium]
MKLFSDRQRTSVDEADFREAPFAYLNRTGRVPAVHVRAFLEEAFELFPDDAQHDVRQRFISRDHAVHLGALVELVTMAILHRLRFEVEVHPKIPGTTKRPDFRARRGDLSFLVECTTANPREDDARTEDLRMQAVDLLNEVVSDKWTLMYHSRAAGERPIRRGTFLRDVTGWVETLPDTDSNPSMEWSGEGWEAEIVAYRLKPGLEPEGARGGYGSEVVTVDAPIRIRGAVEKKTSAYGDDIGEPLLLVVVPGVEFARDEHLLTALIGDEEWVLHADATVTKTWRPNGAWRDRKGLRGERASAVLYAPRLHVWLGPNASWQLVHHPRARHPLESELIPFAREVTWGTEGQSETAEPVATPLETFELPADWPGSD